VPKKIFGPKWDKDGGKCNVWVWLLKPCRTRCGERERERGARIRKSDRANKQVIAYLAYATIINPENISHYKHLVV
jgi:hypothetical protein